MSRSISLHPLFRIDLVQMIRHGEIGKAMERVAIEIGFACDDGDSGTGESGGGTDKSGTLVLVPTPKRVRALGYESHIEKTNQQETVRRQYARPKPKP